MLCNIHISYRIVYFFYKFFGHAVDIITNCFGSRVLKPYHGVGRGGCLGEGGRGGRGGEFAHLSWAGPYPPRKITPICLIISRPLFGGFPDLLATPRGMVSGPGPGTPRI